MVLNGTTSYTIVYSPVLEWYKFIPPWYIMVSYSMYTHILIQWNSLTTTVFSVLEWYDFILLYYFHGTSWCFGGIVLCLLYHSIVLHILRYIRSGNTYHVSTMYTTKHNCVIITRRHYTRGTIKLNWLTDWLFNGTSTHKGHLVPTAGTRLSRLVRMANETQCIKPNVTR